MASQNQSGLKSLSIAELKKLTQKKRRSQNTQRKNIINPHPDVSRRYFPLTSFQQGIWVMDRLLDHSAYNNPYAVKTWLDFELDPQLLAKTVDAISRRHSIFRTCFVEHNGAVMQYVGDGPGFQFKFDDLRKMPEQDLWPLIESWAKAEGKRDFQLDKGPLAYWHIIRASKTEYVFLMTFHHIISDGWMVNLCIKEFTDIYAQLAMGIVPSQKPELQYSDYALAEQQWLASDYFDQGYEFWKENLADIDGVLNLVTDYPRPATMSSQGGLASIHIEPELWDQIQSFSRSHQMTGFHLFIAAYQLLLHFYSGQKEIIIGAPFANRNLPETQQIMGLMMNTLPLCFQVDSSASIETLFKQVSQQSDAVMAHQNVPFNRILELLTIDRNLQINPVFQAILTYQVFNNFIDPSRVRYAPFKVDYGVSKLDLNLWVEEEKEGLLLTFYYDSALFKPQRIERMLSDLVYILQWLIEHPKSHIRELSLLRSESQSDDMAQIKLPEAHPFRSILKRFSEQVAESGDMDAVSCAGQTLTYQQLDQHSDRLAAWFLEHNVKPGQVIALALSKNQNMVVAILATFKVGCCYLPIDKKLSLSRIESMLERSETCLWVGDYTDKPETNIAYLSLDECPSSLNSSLDFVPEISGDESAYIIFTSGSSGQPKGVVVSHRALSGYCETISPVLQPEKGAHYGMFSSFSTDLAHTMVFSALTSGGCLDVIDQTLLDNPVALQNYLAEHPMDYAKFTPSHLAALMQVPEPHHILPKQLLVLGGEALPYSLIDSIRCSGATCRVINHYGPTEATVGVAYYPVPEQLPRQEQIIPIGQAFDDSRLLILDSQHRLLPDGLPGEIYIASHHLADGYIGQPELTQKSFVFLPEWPQMRMYKTGDRGYRLDNGNIVFLGRMDRQVKIRGFRVELAEIEQQLMGLGVKAAAVSFSNHQGFDELIAYVSGVESSEQSLVKEKAFKQLPSYMCPDYWYWLDMMPLTASGKIDRQTLASLPIEREAVAHRPVNQMEESLHSIYSDLLNLEEVDTHLSFFELGGQSLIALKLVIQINSQFGSSLELGDLLKHSSITQLAEYLSTQPESSRCALVCLQEGDLATHPTLLFVHPAGGYTLCYQLLAESLGNDFPVYGLQVADFTKTHDYDFSIESLAAFYLTQIDSLLDGREIILGGWSLGATIAFEMAQQLRQQSHLGCRVLILDQPAPKVQIDHAQSMTESERLAYFAKKVGLFIGKSLDIDANALQAKNKQQRAELFFNEFKQASLIPDNLPLEYFSQFLEILQAHIQASDHYKGQPYDGELIVVEAKEILEGRIRLPEPGLGWTDYTQQSRLISTDGNHLSILNPPYVTRLAEQLKGLL
ncbi:MAG: Dimodular nonribosomal peptide synthase [Candidatus Celerinatantimonas neptuna]|nr:MAG: Dimodular nonribosomal peptide synthase [Candidatus Celerinatantimonas neptuna]